jgi:hypothetical protein
MGATAIKFDKGRGWIYLLLDLVLRVCYIGSTQGFVPVRIMDHARRGPLDGGRYYGSKEVLRGYEGFGKGRRHVAIDLTRVVGDKNAIEFREGMLQSTGFWMCLAGIKYKCWENDFEMGYRTCGIRSCRLRKRRVVMEDTVFKNQDLVVAGGVPQHLSVRRNAGLRRGGICWMCGSVMVGGCNAAAGPTRRRHNAMVAEHRCSGEIFNCARASHARLFTCTLPCR